ncbi:MAG: amidase [Ilumatobacteraceae bacterium]|nr:amidase [Ilumatobacteraceae bacterium]
MSDKEMHWWSTTETAQRIAAKEVSSREVLEHMVDRADRLDGQINAIIQRDLDRARATANAADAAIAAGQPLGPLHGVPMTVKDSFQTEGCITTSGAPELADFVPSEDADPVARVRDAGAVIWGKTNLPIWAGDIQSYNEVYGTTLNPFNPDRTCGGSSGGSAASLAMGFTSLEIGSDIGGSIRVPAHYSGVVGHKPSFGIVPSHGQIPGMPGTFSQADIAVTGPMARHVEDLELAMDILIGPDRWNAPGWRVDLPAPRQESASDLRVAAWIDDDAYPVDGDTNRVLTDLVHTLTGAGVSVDTGARPGFTLEKAVDVFQRLLYAALSGGHPREKLDHMAADSSDTPLGYVKRNTAMRHRDWLSNHERRLQIRKQWEEFFHDFDIMLMPVQPRDAIEHDHSEPQFDRTVMIDGVQRPYTDLFTWVGPSGVAFLPSTVVPVGMSSAGLPIGVQIVAPYLEDRTAMHFAKLVSALCGGCPRPAAAG